MTISTGMVYQGRVIEGSDFVQRSSDAWYSAGDDDVYRRTSPIYLLTGHWTAGPRRAGVEAAVRTYRAMQARRKDNGEEMSVSAQFVLSDDGVLTQLADLELCCVHAAKLFNVRGLSVEYTMPGTEQNAHRIGRPEEGVERVVAGEKVRALRPSPAALATMLRFANLLASLHSDKRYLIGSRPLFQLDRHAYTRRERFTGQEMLSCSGMVEHFHAAGTTKVDAAGWFVDHLAAAGWPRD